MLWWDGPQTLGALQLVSRSNLSPSLVSLFTLHTRAFRMARVPKEKRSVVMFVVVVGDDRKEDGRASFALRGWQNMNDKSGQRGQTHPNH